MPQCWTGPAYYPDTCRPTVPELESLLANAPTALLMNYSAGRHSGLIYPLSSDLAQEIGCENFARRLSSVSSKTPAAWRSPMPAQARQSALRRRRQGMTFTSKDRTSNATRCIDGQIPVHTHSAPKCHCRRLPA